MDTTESDKFNPPPKLHYDNHKYIYNLGGAHSMQEMHTYQECLKKYGPFYKIYPKKTRVYFCQKLYY